MGAYCLRRRFIRPGIISGPGISRRPGSISRCGFGPGEAEGSKTDNTGTDVKASYTLNIGSAMSSTNPSSIALQSFKKAVEERTGGDLAVNIYTDSALGAKPTFGTGYIRYGRGNDADGSSQLGAL